jgi:hypothetical protein
LKDAKLFYRFSDNLLQLLAEYMMQDDSDSSANDISFSTDSSAGTDLYGLAVRLCRAFGTQTTINRSAAESWLQANSPVTEKADPKQQLQYMVAEYAQRSNTHCLSPPPPSVSLSLCLANLTTCL